MTSVEQAAMASSADVTPQMLEEYRKMKEQKEKNRTFAREYMRKKREEDKEGYNSRKREWYRQKKERENAEVMSPGLAAA